MSEWDGKVALVTGGSRGIGRAIAEALSVRGARVTLTGRSNERAQQTASELSAASRVPLEGIAMDVMVPDSVNRAVEELLKRAGRLDILVNNAGIARDNLLMRMKNEEWNEVISTNVGGLFYCSRAALRPMIRQRGGRIINMSSVVGLMGNAGQCNYAASKAAVLGFTKALAREVASRQITVNAIAPGFINTNMTSELPEESRLALSESIPMRRIGQPEEVADAVVFLASQSASYITGEVLQVNGGLYM